MGGEIEPMSEDEIKFVRQMMKEKEMVRLFWLSVFRWASIVGGMITFVVMTYEFVAKHFWRMP